MYQITEKDPFIIKGKKGKEYKIPIIDGLDADIFGIILKYNETDSAVEKIKFCKEFFLTIAPELEEEGIGDVEYFKIFQDYDSSQTAKQKKKLGES